MHVNTKHFQGNNFRVFDDFQYVENFFQLLEGFGNFHSFPSLPMGCITWLWMCARSCRKPVIQAFNIHLDDVFVRFFWGGRGGLSQNKFTNYVLYLYLKLQKIPYRVKFLWDFALKRLYSWRRVDAFKLILYESWFDQ